ncbi:RHS repeat-associated core domain-containing protein [Shigella flexneri]|uniref:RHS repeat-associated core domain-containing protein n=1 Tax=Shigella flexneri TaxID=623 RepID=UPI000DA4C47F|nr:RHS repeat-associated core domain-containing protein [Shigella flexneri]SRP40794.1 putative Rhs-family protein [Shigella flexneri]
MEEAFWAARQGDALLHTSFMADVLGAVLEVAANVVIDALIVGTTSLLATSVGITMGCTAVVLTGFVAGVAMVYTGVTEKVSEACSALANMLFPPQIEGYILTGSGDTWINSKPAARAAATAASRQDIEAQEAQAKAEQEEAQRQEDARTFRDVAGEYLEMAGAIALAVNPVTGPVLMSRALHDQLSTEEGRSEMVDGVTHFVSELWQPTVASAAPGSTPTPDDKIDCHKHPSSLTQFLAQKKAAFLDDPLGTALNLLNPGGMLETAFQGVNAVIGSISNLFKGDDEPPAAEYIAEGARDVRINSQPATRSGARCTCEARVVNEPGNGAFVSPDVRIGGPLLVVRDIRSGRSQITLVATVALMFLRPGKMLSKIACFAASVGMSMLTQKATSALPHPVNAATGAKYLADDDDFDFSLPGHFPLDWQRVYSSRDERTEGMFGQGWSVMYEVSLVCTPGSADENCMTFVSGMGRRLDMEAVLPGGGFYSPGEGLAAWRVTGHHTDSGEQYRLAWDLAQRRLCVTDGLGRTRYHQWDAQNQVTAYQDEAGQVTTFRWSDEERLLLGMTDPQGGKWRYVYDLQGHITETHDPLGRVEQAQWHPVWHQPETEVDAAGNLLGRRAGERATAENSVVPFNRLMSYRGVHYRYDEFGRAVEKEGRSGTQSYRYDAEHRMVEVTTARGTYRYVYDALGRRTEKQHISPDGKPYNRTKFLWDGMRLAQESRPEGTGSLYIYRDQGSYEPLARVDKAGKEGPNRILYFHTDVNGAPEEMTDSDGKIVWETGYQVWGNTIQEKDHGGVEQNLRYQGQYLDRETGLHYNLHRYYDPDVGRFMVTDPIGLRGGLNLYSYAPNPLKYADPLGLTPCAVSNQKANRLLDSSETKVTVRSRSDAEQLFMDRYLGHNYKNMTGESGPSTKNLMEYLTENKTKAGSYHWDDIKDPSVTKPSYRVSGHGPGNPDGDLPHLQVHQHGGSVRHIFFPWET